MIFDGILGNDQIKTYLYRALSKKALGNSLLFTGLNGIGKGLFAHACARFVLGLSDITFHPDIHIYKPEGKIGLHSIDSMREFSEQVYLAPFQSDRKVFIIHDADRMLTYSANALLKTFEEPSQDSLIILIAGSSEALLPTILSRCRVVRFQPLSQLEIKQFLCDKESVDPLKAENIATLAEGSLARALTLMKTTQNSIRQVLFESWSQGRYTHYKELLQVVKILNDFIEEDKESEKDVVKRSLHKEIWTNLTAHQKDQIEKEAEGLTAMQAFNSFKSLCVLILSWYRDLHLLSVSDDSAFLINQDFHLNLKEALKRDEILPLDQVEKAVNEALMSFQRSTPLGHCLESLFLQLRRL